MKKEETKKIVREQYAKVAVERTSCCGDVNPCCGTSDRAQDISRKIGYSEKELNSVPEGAIQGLGCGNPVAIASLKDGESVLDLGSGPGLDCFLAAEKVGKNGKVIGIDMTPEMLEKARANAAKGNYSNVEFRLGEIENLPVADNSVDVVISNCVINLSPDKQSVFRETFRVLKPGGRIMVSDVVLFSCISGAITKDKYLKTIADVGFREVGIVSETSIPVDEWLNDPVAESVTKQLKVSSEQAKEVLGSVISVHVKGVK
jgi:SAM-dependent methyltransferase